MNRHHSRVLFAMGALFALLSLAGAARADLFALGSIAGEIYRIDSNSGQLIQTYAIPTGSAGIPTRTGLAFDGRILYVSTGNSPPLIDILRLDVVNQVWLDPIPYFSDPPGASLAGLGFLHTPDGDALMGLATPLFPGGGPLEVVRIDVFDTVPSPFGYSIAFLPPNQTGTALDVNPANDEVWFATRDANANTQALLQIDLQGNILSELPIQIGPLGNRLVRGLGFDQGRMYVADGIGNIYEIDPANASTIRSFSIPINGTIGALTGGTVVPESGTCALVSISAAAALMLGRRKRPQMHFAIART